LSQKVVVGALFHTRPRRVAAGWLTATVKAIKGHSLNTFLLIL